MIEIIPNWHPIFVHFTVGLLATSILLYFLHLLLVKKELAKTLLVVAEWNLWIGTFFGVLTVITGFIAYNTVAHDDISHIVMKEHRNLALITLTTFIVLSVWALKHRARATKPQLPFYTGSLLAILLLGSTAWHGGELVYRYGLGVMSLPKQEVHNHTVGETHHHGADGHKHD